MIIQCSIVATCSSGLVIQARYLTEGNGFLVKKAKVQYDNKLLLKDNAQIAALSLQAANKQDVKQWQVNVLDCSDVVFFTQDTTINSVKF